MNILVLTTETSHHSFYVRELLDFGHTVNVICENQKNKDYPFCSDQLVSKAEEYELDTWFSGMSFGFTNFVETQYVGDINSQDVGNAINKLKPDVIFVFGTKKIRKEILNLAKSKFFNLHGGNPECYRGLDSHLWAIYHKDFKNIQTTLHFMDEILDVGDIVFQGSINIKKNMELYQLRAANTGLCLRLSKCLIDTLDNCGEVFSRPQISYGRYYSAMPAGLKDNCVNIFRSFTKKLDS